MSQVVLSTDMKPSFTANVSYFVVVVVVVIVLKYKLFESLGINYK